MKRTILTLVFVFVFVSSAFADNKARIDVLKKQQEGVVTQIQQAQQFIKQKEAQALMLQGAIEELQNQDNPKPKDEKKDNKQSGKKDKAGGK